MEQQSAAYQMGQLAGGLVGCILMIGIPALFIVSLILAIVKKSKAWTVVTIISGLFGLGLVGLAAFGIYKGATAVAKAAKETKILTGPGGQFSIEVPGNWSEQDLGSADASLQVGNLIREEYLIVIDDARQDFGTDMDIGAFAKLAAGLVTDNLGNADVSEMTALEINGLPARRCRIEGTTEGVRIVYQNTYIEGADHYYQVMTWTLPSKETAAFPRFEKAAASFREGNGTPDP